MGWMQFIPSTWESYGVDANGDGVKDPYNPEDAIYAAASYLSAAGMPADTYDAIYAYNHADWYVAEVLANAACYAGIGSAAVGGAFSLTPQLQVLSCKPAEDWRKAGPRRIHDRLRERRRPLRTGPQGRLGAGRGRPPRVELRPRDGQEADAEVRAARPRRRPSGGPTRSTATKTATSGAPTPTTPPRPWPG